MCLSYKPGKGLENQLRYNLYVHCLEIQDLKKNVDIEYKIKTSTDCLSVAANSTRFPAYFQVSPFCWWGHSCFRCCVSSEVCFICSFPVVLSQASRASS